MLVIGVISLFLGAVLATECDFEMSTASRVARGSQANVEVVDSLEACQSFCCDDTECREFSFYQKNNVCVTWIAVDAYESNSKYVSGVKVSGSPTSAKISADISMVQRIEHCESSVMKLQLQIKNLHNRVLLNEPAYLDWDHAPGRNGADGVNGADGAPGCDCQDGVPGGDGFDGAPGLDGQDGEDGVPGLDGENGANGANGARGRHGPTGPTGEDGHPAPPGPTGSPGPAGQDGAHGRDCDGRDCNGEIGAPGGGDRYADI